MSQFFLKSKLEHEVIPPLYMKSGGVTYGGQEQSGCGCGCDFLPRHKSLVHVDHCQSKLGEQGFHDMFGVDCPLKFPSLSGKHRIFPESLGGSFTILCLLEEERLLTRIGYKQ